MAGEIASSKCISGDGMHPFGPVLHSDFYRERSPDGTFPARTETQQSALKQEIAKWASLMGLKK